MVFNNVGGVVRPAVDIVNLAVGVPEKILCGPDELQGRCWPCVFSFDLQRQYQRCQQIRENLATSAVPSYLFFVTLWFTFLILFSQAATKPPTKVI